MNPNQYGPAQANMRDTWLHIPCIMPILGQHGTYNNIDQDGKILESMVYMHIHIQIQIQIRICVFICVYVYIYVYACMCVCMYVWHGPIP